MRRLRIVVFACLLVAATTVLLAESIRERDRDEGTTLRVPSGFQSIQLAVDAAAPGDVIEVAPGTYCEQVVIKKSDLRVVARADEHGRAPVLSGSCAPGGKGNGTGFKLLGTAAAPLANMEVRGFVVESFEVGILLQNVVRSRVTFNEVRDNQGSSAPANQNGILLVSASFNEIVHNFVHDNGHMGIGAKIASHGNTFRANRLVDNQRTYFPSCSMMMFGGSVGNQIIDNDVVDDRGNGIMLGPAGVQTQTLVAGNRVSRHTLAGIIVEPSSLANLIFGNDVAGNGIAGTEPDLLDLNTPTTNLWLRNLGSCNPSNAGC